MRNKVWRRYNNSSLIGNCTICHKPIDRDNDNWHCAHIVSEFRGGATALDNMIPSCPDCNLMMGTQNANEYSNLKYHRDLPKPIITPPQQPHFITLDINSSASSLLNTYLLMLPTPVVGQGLPFHSLSSSNGLFFFPN